MFKFRSKVLTEPEPEFRSIYGSGDTFIVIQKKNTSNFIAGEIFKRFLVV